MRTTAVLLGLSITICATAGAAGSREEARLLARAGHARYVLAVHRAQAGSSSAGLDLREALRNLEEARSKDSTNLIALGYLGLVRLELGRRADGETFDVEQFASAREPLEELFRLSRGWADPATRGVLREIAGVLDAASVKDASVRSWWESWQPRLRASLEAPASIGGVADLLATAVTGAISYEREAAIRELSLMRTRPRGLIPALGRALEQDEATSVRIAAARALRNVRAQGWQVRLAEALRRDESPWVRRECILLLGKPGTGIVPPGKKERSALRAALAGDTPVVAAAAAQVLGELGDAAGALVEHVGSGSALVRHACSRALADMEKPVESIEKLAAMLNHDDARRRASAAYAIGPTGALRMSDAARADMLSLLQDDAAEVRAAAARTVGGLGASMSERLSPLFADPDPRVRFAAASVLVRLASKRAPAVQVLRELLGSPVALRDAEGLELRTLGSMASEIIDEVSR